MKKRILAILITTALAVSVTGCAGNATSGNESSAASSATESSATSSATANIVRQILYFKFNISRGKK